jgi:hypothetical protein
MKKRLIMSFVLSTLCSFSVVSQQKTNSTVQDGLQRINVSTVRGTITVQLPAAIHANDQISGTVTAVPAKIGMSKKDKKRARKQQQALENFTVAFNGNTTPISDTSLAFTIPKDNPNNSCDLVIYNRKGKAIATVPIPITNAERVRNNKTSIQIPTYVRAGNTCHIKGNFDGNMKNSEVKIGDTSLPIIAEAPDRLICEVPNTIAGQQKITVTENGITQTAPCNVVGMNLSVGKFNLLKGESTNLSIDVFGLEGLEAPVEIVVENRTQENISLQGGNTQHITITPEHVSPQGNCNKTIQIQSKRAGDFVIDVTLVEMHDDSNQNTPIDAQNSNQEQDAEPLTNNIDIPDNLISYNPSIDTGYNFSPNALLSTGIVPNVFFSFNVMIHKDQKRKLRNKGRELPEDAPLGPTSPNDKKKPYSRPVPDGIKAPVHEVFPGVWKTSEALLKEAKKEVEKAKAHKGKIKIGVPGTKAIGHLNPHKKVINNQRDCHEEIYMFYQRFRYIDDRTLVMEEQLAPSHKFFIAKGESEVNITKDESGWSVTPSAALDTKKGFSIGIEGSYWKKTTKTLEKGSSKLKGRILWLFHIGRLYLHRKAFVRIKYEYHYEVCKDGSTRNWVETTFTDNWHYWYEWEEELLVASKDDEGNFHRVPEFPHTTHSRNVSGEHDKDEQSYEVEGLEAKYFDNFGLRGWDFFPAISTK